MAKSKFFRVAVEGATTDGRVIERRWIEQAAKNYNRETYAARVNLEHIRGLSPMGEGDFDSSFGAYGDVEAVKAEEITLELAGKSVKRLALFAQIDALDPLVKMNAKGQKLYSSIEIAPEFADTGEAYLVGLAVTDSPASLGTELLTFAAGMGDKSPLAGRKLHAGNLFTAAEAIELELEAEDTGEGEGGSIAALFTPLKALIEKLTATAPPAVIEEPAPVADPATPADPAFAEALSAIASSIEGLGSNLSARIDAIEAERTASEIEADTTAIEPFTNRDPATGGEGEILTDC